MTERRAYSRHGLNALKARVKVRGLQAIDRRTAAARALLAWRAELIADLGGEDAISTQQQTLVEIATRTKLYVDSLDAWIMEHGNLMNARKRGVLPVVKDRMQLADALVRYLTALGLQRRTKQVPDLGSYLAGKKSA